MGDFVSELKQQLAALAGLEGAEFAQRFKEIEARASASPLLLHSPYNVRQFELLLRPHRDAIKRSNVRGFSLAPAVSVSASSPAPLPALSTPTTATTTTATANPPTEILTGFPNADLAYSNLAHTTIYVGSDVALSALTLEGLQSCEVHIAGPVLSSVMVRNCAGCVFRISSSAQARIHQCTDSSFYLQCATSPVIEKCTALRFGRYGGTTERYTVKDFNWLRATPSPNWTWDEDGKSGGM